MPSYTKHSSSISDTSELVKEVCLPTEEVKIWLYHLETIAESRKRGAKKAAKTRRAHRNTALYCGICGEVNEDETTELQNWIACDH